MKDTLEESVVALDDERACNAALVGGKAAALARAARSGLPVLPGFAIAAPSAGSLDAVVPQLRPRWAELSRDGAAPLVVRSSSLAEDTETSSMAGRFRSVLGARSWPEFLAAVRSVVESAERGAADRSEPPAMGVLVQPQLFPLKAGVLFGVDPVTGREDRLVVTVAAGGPDRLVSGEIEGSRYELDHRGAVVGRRPGEGGARLSRRERRSLAGLASRTAAVFGGPQDVEWAVDHGRSLVLLQSRPVTTPRRGEPHGPVLGPGPVAETFPDALWPLEEDLWVPALRDGLRHALRIARVAPSAALSRSPVVVTVAGRVAADLDLLEGGTGRRAGGAGILDPRPRIRRLLSAVRTGRLRRALPVLTRRILNRADAELCRVPDLAALTDTQLLALAGRCREALVALHGHEVLTGLLVDDGGRPVTGAGVAMAVLAQARGDGRADADVLAETPVVLALVPPAVGPPPRLPPDVGDPPAAADEDGPPLQDGALLREALRLRVRWTQELSARAVWELAGRLAGRELLDDPAEARRLRWEALEAAVTTGECPTLEAPVTTTDPLPARFRLGSRGLPVPVPAPAGTAAGAGGGAGEGLAHHGTDPPEGSVLIVTQLDPGLAPLLGRLAGLVAETGNVLAHAAILAREAGVPTVVGVADARRRFPPGARVRVDGDRGDVTVIDGESG